MRLACRICWSMLEIRNRLYFLGFYWIVNFLLRSNHILFHIIYWTTFVSLVLPRMARTRIHFYIHIHHCFFFLNVTGLLHATKQRRLLIDHSNCGVCRELFLNFERHFQLYQAETSVQGMPPLVRVETTCTCNMCICVSWFFICASIHVDCGVERAVYATLGNKHEYHLHFYSSVCY